MTITRTCMCGASFDTVAGISAQDKCPACREAELAAFQARLQAEAQAKAAETAAINARIKETIAQDRREAAARGERWARKYRPAQRRNRPVYEFEMFQTDRGLEQLYPGLRD
jgi:hypothetical protein